MSLLAKLKKNNANYRERYFPGTEQKIRIRVLTGAETQSCAVSAKKHMADYHGVDYGEFLADVFSEECDWQTLFLAITDPDGNPIADNILEFRAKLSDAERLALGVEYNEVCNECAPQVDAQTEEQFDALVAEVKKKPEAVVRNIYGISLLRRLIVTLASQPPSSPTDS